MFKNATTTRDLYAAVSLFAGLATMCSATLARADAPNGQLVAALKTDDAKLSVLCALPIQNRDLPKAQPLKPHSNGRGGTDIQPSVPKQSDNERGPSSAADAEDDAPAVGAKPPATDGCPYRPGGDLDLLV